MHIHFVCGLSMNVIERLIPTSRKKYGLLTVSPFRGDNYFHMRQEWNVVMSN